MDICIVQWTEWNFCQQLMIREVRKLDKNKDKKKQRQRKRKGKNPTVWWKRKASMLNYDLQQMRITCVQERQVCGRWTRREVFGKEEELGNIVPREPCGPRSLRWAVLADLRLDMGKQGINRNHSFLSIMQCNEKWKFRGWEVFLRGRLDSGRFWRRGAGFWPGDKFLNPPIFIATCIFRRGGITPSCPGGQDWEPALGGGFKQVTARGATCWSFQLCHIFVANIIFTLKIWSNLVSKKSLLIYHPHFPHHIVITQDFTNCQLS